MQDLSFSESVIPTESYSPSEINETDQERYVVILESVEMNIPNSFGVYSPNNLKPIKEMNYDEFLIRYANHSTKLHVCYEKAVSLDIMIERSELVSAYGFGRDGWYIIKTFQTKEVQG